MRLEIDPNHPVGASCTTPDKSDLPISRGKIVNVMEISLNEVDGWVRETRFGIWFQGTRIWNRFVLRAAFSDIAPLVGEVSGVRSILEIGCGEGRAFEWLDNQFQPDRIIGIDVDPQLVLRGEEAAQNCGPHVEIRRGDAANLELSDSFVDLVFCHQTFHHMTYQKKTAREIYRVLAPGGVLIFVESCRTYVSSLLVRLLFRHPMDVQQSAEEYVALLRDTGFVIRPTDISTPYPPWSRPALGLADLFSRSDLENRTHPLVCLAAYRPI